MKAACNRPSMKGLHGDAGFSCRNGFVLLRVIRVANVHQRIRLKRKLLVPCGFRIVWYHLWLAKAISDVAVGQDINWVCRVVFQFLADLTDENSKVSAFISEARTT
jgi:hypothetical protein